MKDKKMMKIGVAFSAKKIVEMMKSKMNKSRKGRWTLMKLREVSQGAEVSANSGVEEQHFMVMGKYRMISEF